jgi:hypothetical protein
MSSLTLPKSGGLVNGELIERPMLALPTGGTASSSLPTPHAGLGERGRDGIIENPKGQQDLQHTLATLLPTPMARDHKEQHLYDGTTLGAVGRKAGVLSRRLALLPTPTTQETHTGPSQKQRNTVPLNQLLVDLLPTPTAQAAKHALDDRGEGTPDDCNLWSVAGRLIGESTPPQSPDGSLF